MLIEVLGLQIVFLVSVNAGCCNDGWMYFEESCYLFTDDINLDWTEATHQCASHRAHLVTVETQNEDTFLRDHANRLFKCGKDTIWFWLGATDEDIEGIWKWYTDDAPVTVSNWLPGQPDNRTAEDCLTLWGAHGFYWEDHFCTEKSHFICEKSINSDEHAIVG